MEFWGTEVTPGKPQVNEPDEESYVHVSQAALGPSKDGKSERVVIRVESGGKNVVLGTLTSGKVDQMTLDLIFDREFTLSHSSSSASVFFCGYRTDKAQGYDEESDEEDDEEESEEEDGEPVPTAVPIKQNGTVLALEGGVKAAKKQAKVIEQVVETKTKKSLKASLVEPEAEEGEVSDEDDDDDDDEDSDKAMTMDFDSDDYDEEDDSEFEVDDKSGSDLGSDSAEDDSDEDDDEDESDEEGDEDSDEDDDEDEDVAADVLGKKRSLQSSAKKSPASEGKKARLDTPAKPGSQTAAEYWESLIILAGRKGLITTPGKKGAKGSLEAKRTPLSTKKSEAKAAAAKTPQKTPGKEAKEAKTPKSEKTPAAVAGDSAKKVGTHHCVECKRNFATESALSQHDVAKHKK